MLAGSPLVVALAASCNGMPAGPRAGAVEPIHQNGPARSGGEVQTAPTAVIAALPARVGEWTRAPEVRRIEAATIFDYMDGAGEIYLAYRFGHLDVIEYAAAPGDEITVELYFMESADDAFGVLSMDWGGEPVVVGQPSLSGEAEEWPRALYGGGLLRLRSGSVYARIMGVRETEASKQAVLDLGRAIATASQASPAPQLARALSGTVGAGWRLRRDSVCFLRSHLVLNSAYFLSQQNILNFWHGVDGVTARFDGPPERPATARVRVVLVRYPDAHLARQAATRFRQAYLPETQRGQGIEEASVVRIEDGWVGVQRRGRCLALALECPEREDAVAFVQAGLESLGEGEASHE